MVSFIWKQYLYILKTCQKFIFLSRVLIYLGKQPSDCAHYSKTKSELIYLYSFYDIWNL